MTAHISIVMPCYNGQKYLGLSLQSLLDQNYENWSALVVDDGSKDDTAAVVEAFGKRDGRVRLLQQANAGVSVARNLGLAESDPHAPFVLFFDHDDLLTPTALGSLARRLEEEPTAVAAYGRVTLIDPEGRAYRQPGTEHLPDDPNVPHPMLVGKKLERTFLEPLEGFARFVTTNPIYTPGSVLFRKAFLPAGPFRPEVRGAEDWDLYVRASRCAPFALADEVVLRYRIHPAGISRNWKLMARGAECVRKYAMLDPANTPAQRQLAVDAWRATHRSRARARLDGAKQSLRRAQVISALKHLKHAVRHSAKVAFIGKAGLAGVLSPGRPLPREPRSNNPHKAGKKVAPAALTYYHPPR